MDDERFLRKTRTRYEAEGVRLRVSARQVLVRDAVASVTSVALEDVADMVEALAEDVALALKPTGR
ncbi:MAG: hypothetical protein ACREIT_04950 [Tepidisphaeraceae bacterium]